MRIIFYNYSNLLKVAVPSSDVCERGFPVVEASLPIPCVLVVHKVRMIDQFALPELDVGAGCLLC